MAAQRTIASSKEPTSELQWPTDDKLCTIGPSVNNISVPLVSDPAMAVGVAEILLVKLVELTVLGVREMSVPVTLMPAVVPTPMAAIRAVWRLLVVAMAVVAGLR